MPYRLYVSAVIGRGVIGDAYRAKVTHYVPMAIPGLRNMWDWLHDGRPIRYALVLAEDAVHASILEDPEIIPLSPLCADESALIVWLDQPVASIPPRGQEALWPDGVSVEQLPEGATIRDMLIVLRRVHVDASHQRLLMRQSIRRGVPTTAADVAQLQALGATMRLRLGPIEA